MDLQLHRRGFRMAKGKNSKTKTAARRRASSVSYTSQGRVSTPPVLGPAAAWRVETPVWSKQQIVQASGASTVKPRKSTMLARAIQPRPVDAATENKRARSALGLSEVNNAEKQSHDSSLPVRDQKTCKSRPSTNKRKTGSGGSRGFIPWCR